MRTDCELLASDFAAFYERHLDAVTGYVGRRVRDPEAIVDLVAETFTRALARRGQFDPAKGPAIAWLQGIARNLIIDSARRNVVAADAHGRLGGDPAATRGDHDAFDGHDGLRTGLAALPDEQRDALLRRFVLDQSYPEIAAHQRVSEQVARQRVSRGRATLRAYVSIAACVLVALAIGAALLLAGRTPPRPAPAPAARPAQLSNLIREYGILRRPQTAGDRAAVRELGGQRGMLDVVGETDRVHATVVPGFARSADVGGLQALLYIIHVTVAPGASRAQRALAGYWLAVHATIDHTGIAILVVNGDGRHAPDTDINMGTPEHRFAIVPDGVARVTWSWPQEIDPFTVRALPAGTVTAPAHDNVALAAAARPTPRSITWYAPDGGVLYRNTTGPTAAQITGVSINPAELAQAARAKKNPATPNRVVITPATIARGQRPHIYFRALLPNAIYTVKEIAPAHGCHGAPRVGQFEPTHPRAQPGDLLDLDLAVGVPRCPGRYTVAVSVVRGPTIYTPFGSAMFTVR